MTATPYFVSYSSKDDARVRALIRLKGNDFRKRCFFAPETIDNAAVFARTIATEIAACDEFHLFWSKDAAESKWVAKEIALALDRWRDLGRPDGFFHAYKMDGEDLVDDVEDNFHAVDVSPVYTSTGPSRMSVGRLPKTGTDLFGRDEELRLLDAAWSSPTTNAISIVAWGGVGKSALVNKWLADMAAHNHRGAELVFEWSFYSQGAAEGKQASADLFIEQALKWFGDPDPSKGSPWAKGERLAALIRKQRTLLVLDGMEPLQFPPGVNEGKIKDPALESLLCQLARHNNGLVVITSRMRATDLDPLVGKTFTRVSLDHLSPEAGRFLLRARDVEGPDGELEEAAEAFGGHALALTLVGNFLAEVHRGDVRKHLEISPLEQDDEQGGHAIRVMESYRHWLGDGVEVAILHLLGLFDRPADVDAIEVLREAPAIPGLTDSLVGLPEKAWLHALARLRRAGLLLEREEGGDLDAHPLVREHFGQRLRDGHPDAWKEAHRRLYEYFKGSAEELPGTLAGLEPLYGAVAHGCAAGRHQEAYDLYRNRIQRGAEHFVAFRLGAFATDLAGISNFFVKPWRQPVESIGEGSQSRVLALAGFHLRALGRLQEAAGSMETGLPREVASEDWRNASITAANLSELYLTLGDLAQAEERARQAVEFADRSGDELVRRAMLTGLADALHQQGRLDDAEELLREAEEMQRKSQPAFRILYSLGSFRFCALLLELGEYREVLERAEQTLEWVTQARKDLLSIALDHLSLGRAHCAAWETRDGDMTEAESHLRQAVDGLRAAGTQHNLPWGLLARAAFYRLRNAPDDHELATTDLEEALTIATRGEMKLHKCDAHLERARLSLAQGDAGEARKDLELARQMVTDMGYHRRDPEVADLAAKLGESTPSP